MSCAVTLQQHLRQAARMFCRITTRAGAFARETSTTRFISPMLAIQKHHQAMRAMQTYATDSTRLAMNKDIVSTIFVNKVNWSEKAAGDLKRYPEYIKWFYRDIIKYVHPLAVYPSPLYALSFLPTPPPDINLLLVVGTSTTNPPTPKTFTENPYFRLLLQQVLEEHAQQDPETIEEAFRVWGASLGFARVTQKQRDAHFHETGVDKYGPVGGWHHMVDKRLPYGGGMRIPEPQDILGSLLVDWDGKIHGGYQACDGYRMITRDGFLKLTPYCTKKLVERLEKEETESGEAGGKIMAAMDFENLGNNSST